MGLRGCDCGVCDSVRRPRARTCVLRLAVWDRMSESVVLLVARFNFTGQGFSSSAVDGGVLFQLSPLFLVGICLPIRRLEEEESGMRVTKVIVQTGRTGKSCSGFASTFMSGSMSQLVSKLPMRSFVEPMAPWWPPRPRDMVAGSVDAGPKTSCDCSACAARWLLCCATSSRRIRAECA